MSQAKRRRRLWANKQTAMPVQITPDISLPDEDLTWSFVRASGPGGQNVNKVASAAQLRFDLAGTMSLEPAVKARLRSLAGRRVTEVGALVISARNQRTQEGNRREALERLTQLVRRALVAPKVRRATHPTRASRERRLEGKTRRRTTKRLRNKVRWDE
jgi:ribosome-associated protein